MKECVNIGLIGCGWIAERTYIPILSRNQHARIVAVFDKNIERARQISDRYGISNVFDNIDEFLQCELDGVIIVTPNNTHYYYTMCAIEKKIGVLCEKPLVLNEAEIDNILQKVKEKNAVYIPGYVNRWRKDIQLINREIQNGRIGKVSKLNAGWIRKSGVPRPGTWFTSQKYAGGGVLTDLGSHIVDLCLLLLGNGRITNCRLIEAMCNANQLKENGVAAWFNRNEDAKYKIDVEESVIADVVFENNKELSVKLSWNAPITADCTYFKIEGSEGSIELRTLFGFSNERLWPEDIIRIEDKQGKKEIRLDKEQNNTINAFEEMISYYVEVLGGKNRDIDMFKDAANAVSLTKELYRFSLIDEQQIYARLLEDI